MQAQVRTIVALTGERLVVMPEAQYTALVDAAARSQASEPGSPAQMMAAIPASTSARPAVRRTAPKASTAAAAVAPAASAGTGRKGSLEDVLLFG